MFIKETYNKNYNCRLWYRYRKMGAVLILLNCQKIEIEV